jgi:hypothetical protein
MATILVACSLVAAVAGAKVGAPSGASSASLPHPAPLARPDGFDPAAENAKCASCHREIAAEWQGSMHRRAFEDPVFQQAYSIERFPFCRGCHAPESDPTTEPTQAASDMGVSCLTCHVQAGKVVGASDLAHPHEVAGDARMATRAACASCHQFDFPRVPGQPMQDTLEEHRRSSLSQIECQGCHMTPEVGEGGKKHKSHDFAVLSDPAMIRSAAKITASRGAGDTVLVTLTADRVGHAFPTGDMFRRLEIRATAVDAHGKTVASAAPVHLARKFADQPIPQSEGGLFRAEVADTRVPAPGRGSRIAKLVFDAPVGAAEIRWVVAYQRMDHAMAASFGVDPARDEIVVATGSLPVSSP